MYIFFYNNKNQWPKSVSRVTIVRDGIYRISLLLKGHIIMSSTRRLLALTKSGVLRRVNRQFLGHGRHFVKVTPCGRMKTEIFAGRHEIKYVWVVIVVGTFTVAYTKGILLK